MTLNSFNFNTTPGLRFGSGQAKDSCKEISKKLGPRILFITDEGLMSLGLTKPTIEEKNLIKLVQLRYLTKLKQIHLERLFYQQ
jgi:alcohol dehydrogenase class IV